MANTESTVQNAQTIHDFKTKLAGGGARPNLFECSIPSFPAGVIPNVGKGKDNDDKSATDTENTGVDWSNQEFKFLCKAAQLPASTIAEIPVPFRGRVLKVAGDRTFEPWTVTIINDENFYLRSRFEYWMNQMVDLTHGTGITNPNQYMCDAYVTQLGRGTTVNAQKHTDDGTQTRLRGYKFKSIFPTEVSAIDLSYDSTDTIEEFTVTFQVQDFRIGKVPGNGSDASGFVIA